MVDRGLLENLRFVVDSSGNRAAVQIDIGTWNSLLEYIEDLEDRSLVREKRRRIMDGPENAGAINWDSAKGEW